MASRYQMEKMIYNNWVNFVRDPSKEEIIAFKNKLSAKSANELKESYERLSFLTSEKCDKIVEKEKSKMLKAGMFNIKVRK